MDDSTLGLAVSIASVCRLLGLTWVGVRVLRIGRRTRTAPELLLGVSFLTFSTLGVPLLGFAGYGASHLADANVPLLSFALGLLDFGTVCFAAFVWRVFRPEAKLGALAVSAAAISLAAHVIFAARAMAAAGSELSPIQAIGSIEGVLSTVMSATFAWGAAEAFAYWGSLRRQHALGLADSVAVRRMFWFAMGCASQLGMMAFTLLASVRGTNPLADPLPALGIAVTSLATGGAFALALGSAGNHASKPVAA